MATSVGATVCVLWVCTLLEKLLIRIVVLQIVVFMSSISWHIILSDMLFFLGNLILCQMGASIDEPRAEEPTIKIVLIKTLCLLQN